MLNILTTIQNILNLLLPVLITLGIVYFVWGVLTYVIASEEEAKKKGRDRIIYGIIGLAIIFSLFGIVNILTNTLFDSQNINAPVTNKLVAVCSSGNGSTKIQDVFCKMTSIIGGSIIPLIFSLAVILFAWGVIKFFIINADEEAKRNQGKQFIIWGLVAMVVIVSMWGLVGMLGGSFGFSRYTNVLPGVRPSGEPISLPPASSGGGTGGGGITPKQCTPGEECTDSTSMECPYLSVCSSSGFWPN